MTIHRAWMNHGSFEMAGKRFQIVDGIETFVHGRLMDVIRFIELKKHVSQVNGKNVTKWIADDKIYEYTEFEFFDKVKAFDVFIIKKIKNDRTERLPDEMRG